MCGLNCWKTGTAVHLGIRESGCCCFTRLLPVPINSLIYVSAAFQTKDKLTALELVSPSRWVDRCSKLGGLEAKYDVIINSVQCSDRHFIFVNLQ